MVDIGSHNHAAVAAGVAAADVSDVEGRGGGGGVASGGGVAGGGAAGVVGAGEEVVVGSARGPGGARGPSGRNGVVGDADTDSRGPSRAVTRVVVADDADGVRELMCLLLETEPDFTVVGYACNGAEAVEVVGRTVPDLVLLDVAMPVLDGLGALPQLRRIAPDACVVVFTGFSEESLREQALALGADALLEKGVATGSLVAALRAACQARRTTAGPVPAKPRAVS